MYKNLKNLILAKRTRYKLSKNRREIKDRIKKNVENNIDINLRCVKLSSIKKNLYAGESEMHIEIIGILAEFEVSKQNI